VPASGGSPEGQGAPAAQQPAKLSRPAGQKGQGDGCEQDGQEDEGYKLLRMQTHWPGGDWLELWVCPSSAGKDRCSKEARHQQSIRIHWLPSEQDGYC